MLQWQNDILLQNVVVRLDFAHWYGRRHNRQCWVRNWILERPLFGQYEVLIDQLLNSDVHGYRNFVRLSPELFTELMERVDPAEDKISPATSTQVEGSHHPQIPGYRGLLQEPDLWLQGGFQHHIPRCARGV